MTETTIYDWINQENVDRGEIVGQTRISPKSHFPVIESLTGQGINVRNACRLLGVSESGYTTGKTGRRPRRR
jgi:hypothetical protein